MSEVTYNWLFANDEDEGRNSEEEEEEDFEEIQSYLYSTIHYEQMQDDTIPRTEVTARDVAYDLELQEEIFSDGEERAKKLALSTAGAKQKGSVTPKDVKKTHSPSRLANLDVSQSPQSKAKKRKSKIDIIDLVSESDGSATGNKRSEKFIVIDSISDESDLEITSQMEKRRKLKHPKNSTAKEVIRIWSDSSSSSSDESVHITTSPATDIKINAHLGRSPSVVLNCDDLDIKLDTTLEDIHASIGECDWSLTDNNPQYASQRSRTLSRYYTPFDVRCNNCNQVGHLSKLCPKPKKRCCCLCGEPGHLYMRCPDRLCHNCGKPGHELLKCPNPKRSRFFFCKRCGMAGHNRVGCSEVWRQFHISTTSGKLVEGFGRENKRKYCYNCGEKGHWGHACENERMTKFVMVGCPLITMYDQRSRIMSTVTTSKRENISDKPSTSTTTSTKSLKGKLKNYMSKARKVSKKASSTVTSHEAEKSSSKLEYKYAEGFPRGAVEKSTRGHPDNKDKAPPHSNSNKSTSTKFANSSKPETGKSGAGQSEKTDAVPQGYAVPQGFSRKALKKLLYQEAMGTISKKGKKKLKPYSRCAQERGYYDTVAATVYQWAASSKKKTGNAQPRTATGPANSSGKRTGKNRVDDAPDAVANQTWGEVKQTLSKTQLRRMKKLSNRLGDVTHDKSHPLNMSNKKNDRGFRFNTNEIHEHWRKTAQGYRFSFAFD